MDVKIFPEIEERKLTAVIYGDIDHHTAKFIRGEIDAAIREHNPETLILDFKYVTFMDSSGIGLVMGRYKIMNELGGEVLTANPAPYIRKVMQLAGLHRLSRIISSYTLEEKPDSNSGTESADTGGPEKQLTAENK